MNQLWLKQKIWVFTVFSHERDMEKTMDSCHYFSQKPGLYGNHASDLKINNRFINGVDGAIMAVNVIFCWKVPLTFFQHAAITTVFFIPSDCFYYLLCPSFIHSISQFFRFHHLHLPHNRCWCLCFIEWFMDIWQSYWIIKCRIIRELLLKPLLFIIHWYLIFHFILLIIFGFKGLSKPLYFIS